MSSDPVATADLVVRHVRSAARDGAPTKVVVARRTYATDPGVLWSAIDRHGGEYGPGAAGLGWDLAMLGLGLHLETGAAAARTVAAYTTPPEG